VQREGRQFIFSHHSVQESLQSDIKYLTSHHVPDCHEIDKKKFNTFTTCDTALRSDKKQAFSTSRARV